ncbi:acyloxyacyl hydrolase [Salegentibacter sp. F14]
MKKLTALIFFFTGLSLVAQETKRNYYSFDASYFIGTILEHNTDIAHLITDHPEAVILGFNKKSFGFKDWEKRYNYPDVGVSFTYQDMKETALGENYGLYAHMNFYLLKRNLMFRIGQGLAYSANPYHADKNFRNNAYGSRILSTTYLMANLKKENIVEGLGFQAGLAVIHYSNADFKSPNTSTNTMGLNLGLNYVFDHQNLPDYIPKKSSEKYTEPLHFNFVLRGGVNTMGVIGSKQYPFLTFSTYADKVLNPKSTLQAGAELFLSKAMAERIRYQSIAFPSGDTTGEEDSKRVGGFVGHQLVFDKLSVITHLGYYFYYPYEHYVGRLYNRIGLQRVLNEKLWASVTVRSHWANAEAVELSIGYRL